jgi:hypothetical protein
VCQHSVSLKFEVCRRRAWIFQTSFGCKLVAQAAPVISWAHAGRGTAAAGRVFRPFSRGVANQTAAAASKERFSGRALDVPERAADRCAAGAGRASGFFYLPKRLAG